ncbi:MAG TPA: cytochrome c biogenesis protein CcsA [Nocardioidaceae bacterium]|nr:cytochrome c biogenesis protein CcsA [Nocardioidaceae bacterium]
MRDSAHLSAHLTHRDRRGVPLGLLASATALVAALLALVVAPPDALQGQAQRLMYVHVPSAWTAFLAFGVVSVTSLATLVTDGRRAAAVGQAAAELGVAMTGLTLAEGSMWGHSAWGAWWAWDPRLVSTALLFLLYVGYLAARALPGDPRRVRRRAAVVGACAFVQVPVVHFSVLWWRSLHQPPTLLRPELSAPIAASMLVALLVSLLAFSLGGLWYVRRRSAALLGSAAGHRSPAAEGAAVEAPARELATSPVRGPA